MISKYLLIVFLLLPVAGCAADSEGDNRPIQDTDYYTPIDETTLFNDDYTTWNPEILPERFTERVKVRTSLGSFVLGLYGNDAPNTVANFLAYVDSGFYVGTVFHRVIPDFMIQGGGYTMFENKVPTLPPLTLEIVDGLAHKPGILSMARKNDPHSATCQFFICVGVNPWLDGEYAAFGAVEHGYNVVKAISQVQTVDQPMADLPYAPVLIQAVERIGLDDLDTDSDTLVDGGPHPADD